MKQHFLLLNIILLFLFSCGPSKEQQAIEEKRKLDSTAQAAKSELIQQQDSIRLEEERVRDAEMLKEGKKNRLIVLKGRLAAEESKMQGILRFQLGRLQSEKDTEVGKQTMVIEKLKTEISDLERELEQY